MANARTSALFALVGLVLGGVFFWPKKAKAEIQAPGSGSATPHERALSHRTGLTVATLRAIAKVESGGGSRQHAPNDGRGSGNPGKPKLIRFEPHAFLYNTRASGSTGDRAAKRRTSPYFSQIPYTPSGRDNYEAVSFVSSETKLDAFTRAFALNRSEAIRATSWGRFQVMGGWFKNRLASDPVAFYSRWVNADKNEVEDLSDEMLVEWIMGNPLALQAAKDQNWTEFSRRYNGTEAYAPQFVEAYAEAVTQGAPTTVVA